MHRFLEGLKDFLYDSIDYIIMIGIIGIVIFIIGWRLDLLFANSGEDIISKDNIITETKSKRPNSEEIIDPIVDDEKEPKQDINEQNTIAITIPPGSSSSNIGSILESNGLISSTSDFINKSEEMQLSNKLKAGNYHIQSGSSMEIILETLTK